MLFRSQIVETTDVDVIPDKITNSLQNTENQNNLNPVDIDEKLKIKLKNGDTKDSKVGLVTEPVKQVSLNVLVNSGRLLSVEEKEVGDVSIKVLQELKIFLLYLCIYYICVCEYFVCVHI